MINQLLISPRGIIGKVISDNDLRTEDVRVADISTWIGEAIEKIGAYSQFEKKIVALHFDNYIAELPSDLYRLKQVAYSADGSNWLPMVVGSSSYDSKRFAQPDGDIFVHENEYVTLVKMLYNITDTQIALELLNSSPEIRTTLDALLQSHNYSLTDVTKPYSDLLKYQVNLGKIKLNIRDGYIRIAYLAMQVDEEGLPLIPDMDEYREAIYRYCTMKLFYPRYLSGQLNMNIYQDMQQEWAWARQGAYAAAMMPSVDGLEAIRNDWVKLFPDVDRHSDFFDSLGDKQLILNR
jgi:hypothetical protein